MTRPHIWWLRYAGVGLKSFLRFNLGLTLMPEHCTFDVEFLGFGVRLGVIYAKEERGMIVRFSSPFGLITFEWVANLQTPPPPSVEEVD